MKNDNKELLNLAEFKEKIRDVSKSDKENFIDSDIEIINFDKVKKAYCKKRTNIENTPKSNDGLYISGESMVFLEFKNANAKDIDIYDLSKKNYDSVCMLSDIMGISIREIREKTKYILIYSSEKNSKIELATTSPISLICKSSSIVAFLKLSKFLYFLAKSFAVFTPTFLIPSA